MSTTLIWFHIASELITNGIQELNSCDLHLDNSANSNYNLSNPSIFLI